MAIDLILRAPLLQPPFNCQNKFEFEFSGASFVLIFSKNNKIESEDKIN
jgi:hypothetical protein